MVFSYAFPESLSHLAAARWSVMAPEHAAFKTEFEASVILLPWLRASIGVALGDKNCTDTPHHGKIIYNSGCAIAKPDIFKKLEPAEIVGDNADQAEKSKLMFSRHGITLAVPASDAAADAWSVWENSVYMYLVRGVYSTIPNEIVEYVCVYPLVKALGCTPEVIVPLFFDDNGNPRFLERNGMAFPPVPPWIWMAPGGGAPTPDALCASFARIAAAIDRVLFGENPGRASNIWTEPEPTACIAYKKKCDIIFDDVEDDSDEDADTEWTQSTKSCRSFYLSGEDGDRIIEPGFSKHEKHIMSALAASTAKTEYKVISAKISRCLLAGHEPAAADLEQQKKLALKCEEEQQRIFGIEADEERRQMRKEDKAECVDEDGKPLRMSEDGYAIDGFVVPNFRESGKSASAFPKLSKPASGKKKVLKKKSLSGHSTQRLNSHHMDDGFMLEDFLEEEPAPAAPAPEPVVATKKPAAHAAPAKAASVSGKTVPKSAPAAAPVKPVKDKFCGKRPAPPSADDQAKRRAAEAPVEDVSEDEKEADEVSSDVDSDVSDSDSSDDSDDGVAVGGSDHETDDESVVNGSDGEAEDDEPEPMAVAAPPPVKEKKKPVKSLDALKPSAKATPKPVPVAKPAKKEPEVVEKPKAPRQEPVQNCNDRLFLKISEKLPPKSTVTHRRLFVEVMMQLVAKKALAKRAAVESNPENAFYSINHLLSGGTRAEVADAIALCSLISAVARQPVVAKPVESPAIEWGRAYRQEWLAKPMFSHVVDLVAAYGCDVLDPFVIMPSEKTPRI